MKKEVKISVFNYGSFVLILNKLDESRIYVILKRNNCIYIMKNTCCSKILMKFNREKRVLLVINNIINTDNN